jgi:hypothetical protein
MSGAATATPRLKLQSFLLLLASKALRWPLIETVGDAGLDDGNRCQTRDDVIWVSGEKR